MMPVTSWAANDSMLRSQRTGEATCATSRSSARRPEATGSPSLFDQRARAGSDASTPAAAARRLSTAGAMNRVWKAPATWSGITRVPATGLSARAARASSVPAATI